MTYLKSKSWIYNIFSCFWRCQKLDIYKQFSKGVRCFDLRVRMHDEHWVFAHGKSILDSDADILTIIDSLNKECETCDSKVYIRLLLEINEHDSYQENSFISLCELLNEKYKNNDRIRIFECRRKYDWTQLYDFGVYLEVIQYVGSMQTKIYGNNKYAQLMWQVYCPKPAYVSKTIPNHGIKVKRKSIPTNKHFATGNMYFGI